MSGNSSSPSPVSLSLLLSSPIFYLPFKYKSTASERASLFLSAIVGSVCKSGLIMGKRLEPDWTRTCQNHKSVGLFRTITTVQSMVHHKSENLKTKQRPVSTGLSSLEVMALRPGLGLSFPLKNFELIKGFFRWKFDQLWHGQKTPDMRSLMPEIVDLNLQPPSASSLVPTSSLWSPPVV